MRSLVVLLVLSFALPCGGKQAPENSGSTAEQEGPAPWPAMPEPGPAPEWSPPGSKSFTLSNGLAVTYVRSGKVPLVNMQLNVHTGSQSDPAGKSGVADFTADMLNEGAGALDALAFSEATQTLAAGMNAGGGLEYSFAQLNCLEDQLAPSLQLFASMVTDPTFAKADFERVREDRRNRLLAQKDDITTVGRLVFNKLLFGDAYIGRDNFGTLAELDNIERKDLQDFHKNAWIPGNSSLVVVSRLEPGDVIEALDAAFAGWSNGKGKPPEPPAVEAPARPGRHLYWIDKPNASQSFVMLGNVSPRWDAESGAARLLGNRPLGGAFTSRINLNLREDKHWTYGARSFVDSKLMAGRYASYTSVKAAHTADALSEIVRELEGFVGDRPMTDPEFADAQAGTLQGLPSSFEGSGAVLGQFASADALRRPDGWVQGVSDRLRAVTKEQAQEQINAIVDPSKLVVLVVGDLAAHREAVEALDFAPIRQLDEDGNPVAE